LSSLHVKAPYFLVYWLHIIFNADWNHLTDLHRLLTQFNIHFIKYLQIRPFPSNPFHPCSHFFLIRTFPSNPFNPCSHFFLIRPFPSNPFNPCSHFFLIRPFPSNPFNPFSHFFLIRPFQFSQINPCFIYPSFSVKSVQSVFQHFFNLNYCFSTLLHNTSYIL
jgi:hypothetical protein